MKGHKHRLMSIFGGILFSEECHADSVDLLHVVCCLFTNASRIHMEIQNFPKFSGAPTSFGNSGNFGFLKILINLWSGQDLLVFFCFLDIQ